MQISPHELKDALARGEDVALLDVRSADESEICRLKEGRLVTRELLEEILQTWAKDQAIVTYCHHGIRSLDAASFLASHGFTNVRSLSGGIDAWAMQIEPHLARY